ncbi:MAG TPA: T9SS type A sorting domain-containing protein, partial [Pirellula sp.]|nr:T9SS type A sorting domain-containing protein [Pirellula sp.]
IDAVEVILCDSLDNDSRPTLNHGFNIYPNPASDKLTVTNSFNYKSTLHIIDAIGRVVQSSTLEPNIHQATSTGSVQAVLDVSDLPNGLYTIEIIDETLVSTRSKLVVLH